MAYNVTQNDMQLLRQSVKNIYSRIELLNDNFTIIDAIHGYATAGTISIKADSGIRRTCNLTLVLADDSLLRGEEKKVWLNKYIRVFIGYQNARTGVVQYYNQGIYLFGEHSYQYDSTNRVLQLTCYDLMSRLTGLRSGQMLGYSTKIPVESNIRDAMISTVTQLGGFEKYLIEDTGKDVPYDLEYNAGAAVFTVIEELAALYPGYEFFFDANGTFIFQRIPTLESDPYVLDAAILEPLVVSEQYGSTFTEIKNATEVWGACLKQDHYNEDTTYSNGQYAIKPVELMLTDDGKIPSSEKFAFKVPETNPASPTLKVGDLEPFPIVDSADKGIEAGRMEAGKSYLVQFKKGKFLFLGQWQIHGIALLYNNERTEAEKAQDRIDWNCDNITYMINPDSPFAIDRLNETILQVKAGGEYAKIYSDDLAMQRAEYDTWLVARHADSLSLNLHVVPWLDVNQKIQYRVKHNNETLEFIVKSINLNIASGCMDIEATRFYPYYPFVVKDESATT